MSPAVCQLKSLVDCGVARGCAPASSSPPCGPGRSEISCSTCAPESRRGNGDGGCCLSTVGYENYSCVLSSGDSTRSHREPKIRSAVFVYDAYTRAGENGSDSSRMDLDAAVSNVSRRGPCPSFETRTHYTVFSEGVISSHRDARDRGRKLVSSCGRSPYARPVAACVPGCFAITNTTMRRCAVFLRRLTTLRLQSGFMCSVTPQLACQGRVERLPTGRGLLARGLRRNISFAVNLRIGWSFQLVVRRPTLSRSVVGDDRPSSPIAGGPDRDREARDTGTIAAPRDQQLCPQDRNVQLNRKAPRAIRCYGRRDWPASARPSNIVHLCAGGR